MSHHVIEASAHSSASRDAVWALVRDIDTWQRWGTWSATSLQTPAPGEDPQGVGAVRRLRQFPVTNVERVVEVVPGERLAYELVSGLPFENYRGEVRLADGPNGGTNITWRSEFDVTKLRGGISRRALERFFPQIVEKLARGAEQEA
jgi:uncharacterized protein YndB with AHSA1/START domain